jgi:DNA-binding winged helix-turn-helix (wHTH) protein
MLVPGTPDPSLRARQIGYRFAGVEVDLQRALVRVDGVETAIGVLPLRLLRLLCEAKGALVTRQAMFDAIWPRQVVSDEALTRIIGRLREMLRAHAPLLVTVRGQGLRLDSEILPLFSEADRVRADAPVATPIADPESRQADTDPPRSSVPRAHRRVLLWLLAAVCVLALFALAPVAREAVFEAGSPVDTSVFASLAIGVADVQSSRPQTLRLLRLAEVAWDAGDLDRTRELLRNVHADDSASPVAGLLLAYVDERTDAAHWAEEARARFTAQTTPYVRLLAEFMLVFTADRASSRAKLDAVLDVRPQAYRLQMARAHLDIGRRDSAAALRRLLQIPLQGPPPSVLFQALEGRAAYGDGDAVRDALALGVLSDAPIQRGLIEARLSWQRGEQTLAIDTLDRVAAAAQTANAYTAAAVAREAAALYAYGADRPDAAARLANAVRKLIDDNLLNNISELEPLSSELALERGDRSGAETLLASAESHVKDSTQSIALELFNARLQIFPGRHYYVPADLAIPDLSSGEPDLVRAWNAFADGDPNAARTLLAAAQAGGIAQTYFAEDAALLGALLGIETPPCVIELPYPNYVRHSACRALARLKGRQQSR